ncbi:MAG: FAD-binding protein [Actinomycetota bacterium]
MSGPELLHPASKGDVVEAVRGAAADRRRLLVAGGRRHIDKGNPAEIDAELWTTQLDAIVAYEPAEMVAVVEAGVRLAELDAALAEGGQEWPHDAPPDATVGGTIAAGALSPRMLRHGHLRDTVLEVELVTGDGRFVRGGGRTVKNVTGYDLPRVLYGSLGTLGVLVQVALKLRPLPKARRTVIAETVEPIALGTALLDGVPLPVSVLAEPARVRVRLEGWPGELDEQTARVREVLASSGADGNVIDGDPSFPSERPWNEAPIVAEVAVAPSRVPELVPGAGTVWAAPLGTGLLWAGLQDAEELAALRERVAAAGGIAPVVRGPGGLGEGPVAAPQVHRRLKNAFDPQAILAPGRGWGGW